MKLHSFGIFGTGLIVAFHAKAINSLANARVQSFCKAVELVLAIYQSSKENKPINLG